MRELRALTPEEFERAAGLLRNPLPGSRIEAAREFGTDLTTLLNSPVLTVQTSADGRRKDLLTIPELESILEVEKSNDK
jgi:hypothetical protein